MEFSNSDLQEISVMNWRFESKNIFLFPGIIHGKINNFEKIQSKLKKLNLITDGKRLNLVYQKISIIRKFNYLEKIEFLFGFH